MSNTTLSLPIQAEREARRTNATDSDVDPDFPLLDLFLKHLTIVQGLLKRGLLLPSDPAIRVVQPVRHRGPETVCRHFAKGWPLQLRPLQEVIIIFIKSTLFVIALMIMMMPFFPLPVFFLDIFNYLSLLFAYIPIDEHSIMLCISSRCDSKKKVVQSKMMMIWVTSTSLVIHVFQSRIQKYSFKIRDTQGPPA